MATSTSPFLPRSMEERLQSMMMKVEQMLSLVQELQSVKTDVAEVRNLWREEKLDQEDTKKGPACAFDSNLEGQVVHGSDGSSLVDSIGGFQGFSPATCSREVTNDMLGTDRCSTFNAPRNFLEVSHKKTSVSALSTPILIPPSSPLVSSLLFEFDGISPILDSLLVENNSCASKTKIFEEAEWQDLEGTWLYVYHAEKSNASAVSMGEGQMSCISSGYCMCDVMSGSQLLSTIDSWVHWPTKGANIFCISPIMKGILSWALITQFLPTHLFIIMWYKGELIKMLLDSEFLQGSVDNNLG